MNLLFRPHSAIVRNFSSIGLTKILSRMPTRFGGEALFEELCVNPLKLTRCTRLCEDCGIAVI
jgi:hypothetical protein